MRKLQFTIILSLFINLSWAQEIKNVELQTLENTYISTDSIFKKSKYTIIILWASYSPPSVLSLKAINELYDKKEFSEKFETELIPINIDKEPRRVQKAIKYITDPEYSHWNLPRLNYLFDTKLDFVSQVPNGNYGLAPTMLLIYNNEIIGTHIGYSEGAEKDILKLFKNIIKKNN